MLWEVLLLIFLAFFFAQGSSLLSSVLIIPMSILLILWTGLGNVFSAVLLFLFFLVFIGGLMVILVSITSMTYQEQKVPISLLSASFLSLLVLVNNFESTLMSGSHLYFFSDVLTGINSFLLFIVMVLLLGLLVITNLLSSLKGLARSM